MSNVIQKIKEAIYVIQDKYFIEIAYVHADGKSIPELLDKNYIVYNAETLETDFTKDPKKATCFDYAIGSLIVSQLKTDFLGDQNIQIGLITVANANFINDVTGGLKLAIQEALTPQQSIQLKIATQKSKELKDKISRLEGLIGIGAVVNTENGVKLPVIEINVANIESKAKLFSLKSDAEETPFLNQNSAGKTFYKDIPVSIVIQPEPKAQ